MRLLKRNRISPSREGLTAEELATGVRSRSASTTTIDQAPGTAGARQSFLGANSRARGRRTRRGVRRTESGRSISTLPEYSKEAGDEELVLVRYVGDVLCSHRLSCRQRSASDSSGTDDDGEEELASDSREHGRAGSVRSTRSMDSARSHRLEHSRRSVRSPLGDSVRLAQQQRVGVDHHAAEARSGSQSAPIQPARRTLSDVSRRGWGEAPTYLEAMSSPDFPSSTSSPLPPRQLGADLTGAPATLGVSLRTRTSSSLRDLLNRAGSNIGLTFAPASFRSPRNQHEMTQTSRHSSTSLLLHPQSSRLSSASIQTSRERYQSSAPGSPSLTASAPLHISSPVPNSAVRASFGDASIPKAGLSDDQMRFLSSTEAVNLVGVKLGDVPAHKKRRGSVLSGIAPPSWDEVALADDRDVSPGPSNYGSNDGPSSGARADGADGQICVEELEAARIHGTVPPPQPSATVHPSVEIQPPTPHSPTPASGWPIHRTANQIGVAVPEPAVVR